MTGAASKDSRGNYCGRAVHGVSNLSGEDLRQIEKARSGDRPVPWSHLARQYRVCEADLRAMFDPQAHRPEQSAPAEDVEPLVKPRRDRLADKKAVALAMMESGATRVETVQATGLGLSVIGKLRRDRGLPLRSRPWTEAEDRILIDYARHGYEAVGRMIGRSPDACGSRMHLLRNRNPERDAA